jgi:hypothetical protein
MQVIHTDLARNESRSALVLHRQRQDIATIRLILPHSLLFCLRRVSDCKYKSIRRLILNTFDSFRKYVYSSNNNSQIKVGRYRYNHKIGATPSEQFDKFFYHMYPHPLKDKIKSAPKPRKFHRVTSRNVYAEIKQLASIYATTPNGLILSILSYRVAQILNNDPMFFVNYDRHRTSWVIKKD